MRVRVCMGACWCLQFTLVGTTVTLLPGVSLNYQTGAHSYDLGFTATNDATPAETAQYYIHLAVIRTCFPCTLVLRRWCCSNSQVRVCVRVCVCVCACACMYVCVAVQR